MKTKNKDIKEKSVVEQLREIREKISSEIQDMNYEQLMKYLDNKKSLHPLAPWNK